MMGNFQETNTRNTNKKNIRYYNMETTSRYGQENDTNMQNMEKKNINIDN